jgi:hypothetical protein
MKYINQFLRHIRSHGISRLGLGLSFCCPHPTHAGPLYHAASYGTISAYPQGWGRHRRLLSTIQADALAHRLAEEKANKAAAATAAQRLERERQDAHDTALALALQAEEAAAAAKDRDTAAQCANEALARTTKKCPATAAAVAQESSGATPRCAPSPTIDLRTTLQTSAVLLELSTTPSPAKTLCMLFIKSAFICTTPGSLTLLP